MARTKRTEKAVPKMGEIVSFAALKAQRDATRANVFCSVAIIEGELCIGDIALCKYIGGGYTLRKVEAEGADNTWVVENVAEIEFVCGRVVSVQLQTESEGA